MLHVITIHWSCLFSLKYCCIKSFGFQCIAYAGIENWFVIIDRISWVTTKKCFSNFVFILVNNLSVNNCHFIANSILCCWIVGTNYGIDPDLSAFVSGLAWERALRKTKVELDLLPDIDMILMIEKCGICHLIHRYAKPNNKYMKD